MFACKWQNQINGVSTMATNSGVVNHWRFGPLWGHPFPCISLPLLCNYIYRNELMYPAIFLWGWWYLVMYGCMDLCICICIIYVLILYVRMYVQCRCECLMYIFIMYVHIICVSMYVCKYVCMYECISLCRCVSKYVSICVRGYACIHYYEVLLNVHVYVYKHACVYDMYVCILLCSYVCLYVCMWVKYVYLYVWI